MLAYAASTRRTGNVSGGRTLIEIDDLHAHVHAVPGHRYGAGLRPAA